MTYYKKTYILLTEPTLKSKACLKWAQSFIKVLFFVLKESDSCVAFC